MPEMDMVAIKDYDMQVIGSFLHCASRGDKVGLNQMLLGGTSPDVQDYDRRTALHLAASEGHASIVELLIQYNANVNLEDRWQRTPLMDARLYGHRDIIRILEVNGGRDSFDERPMTIRHEHGLNEVNIDPSELSLEHTSVVEQGIFGESKKVKWRGTWVVKTIIKTQKSFLETKKWFAKEISRLRELRHPNILQFLGAIVHEDEIVLITEHLPKGKLSQILNGKVLDIFTSLRYALDIARGMNYLHQHKPHHIVHNYLCPRNLLQDEGGHLKIGEYWVQLMYEKMYPYQENCKGTDISTSMVKPSTDTKRDLFSFANILYEMLEGRALFPNVNLDCTKLNSAESGSFEPKFRLSRCPIRIQQLVKDCMKEEDSRRPTFAAVIVILEEVYDSLAIPGCPSVC
ncbi:uncharacterized protein A4U43_C01F29090 [Asparagus officinalis]|uniref:Protein kinase domain-containing protein n=1 Tax=Asparagus officinalis TaxID=4686 RepID=A0A5P1FT87_ASPOF|nr:integrin-linked protein kinase homolog pat-4-like [Asparagus officinalis]XP_020251789.1 integrin-linked protein kinase homolog pat-4-like [Asparagus officinalis]XP_020251791.1 integrin-linked protein kinase homolog pat-4-like [Asparagus officinalis]ONK81438.1 uncharacterized protein A4U43_C01F29090 [Asparagus officinalis]